MLKLTTTYCRERAAMEFGWKDDGHRWLVYIIGFGILHFLSI